MEVSIEELKRFLDGQVNGIANILINGVENWDAYQRQIGATQAYAEVMSWATEQKAKQDRILGEAGEI